MFPIIKAPKHNWPHFQATPGEEFAFKARIKEMNHGKVANDKWRDALAGRSSS